ncbi:hypothetical protein [Chryseobacterium sp.]|uniref:hypothetical protein n=1 Tax=Chryseobacterium sp. TaxID=1871047 RepID=UPI0025BD4080|nr:hypothetical protein [Chryseobacterium sp.]
MRSFYLTAGIFSGICVIYIMTMLSGTDNFFTYILDDAYIHLAIAKNFALHGVWGMTQYAFSSSSSSPLFTAILSGLIYVFGNHYLIPLLFNSIVAVLVIYFLVKYYSSYFNKEWYIVFASLFTLLFAVLHFQIVTGMEHVFQVLIIVINIYCFQKWYQSDFRNSKIRLGFYTTIVLLGLIRFESMFYFVSLAFIFFLLKKFNKAIAVLILGFVPICVFGYYNYQQSGHFFPNSVVVKGTTIDFSGNYLAQMKYFLFDKILLNVTFYKIAFFPLLMSVVIVCRDYKRLDLKSVLSNNFLIIVWSVTLVLHCLFGDLKGFRYEAYLLVALSMLLIPKVVLFFQSPLTFVKKDPLMTALIVFNILLLIYKVGYAHIIMIKGSENVYRQQIQSARFLEKYYNTSKVVANDIGAICYFSDIHLFDIAGLGSEEMIRFNEKEKVFDDEFENFVTQYSINNHYQLAVVYEEWFSGHIPGNWRKVAVLKIDSHINVALDHVTIYSIDPDIHSELKKNVKKFNWNKNVQVILSE